MLKNRIVSSVGVIICLFLVVFNYSPAMNALKEIPEVIYYSEAEGVSSATNGFELLPPFSVSEQSDVTVLGSSDMALGGTSSNVTIDLFGVIPIKTVKLKARVDKILIPCGQSIGVAMHTKGTLVVGTSEIVTEDGQKIPSPAAVSGIKAGDVIAYANGEEVKNSTHLTEICDASEGRIRLTVVRDGVTMNFDIAAVKDSRDGSYLMGMWVRDSTAGIGTLSFYSPESKKFAALGHAIVDIDTNTLFEVGDGEIINCSIVDIDKGEQGEPGELIGTFSSASRRLGRIDFNSEYGLYGNLYGDLDDALYKEGLPLAYPDDVTVGDAYILAALDGSTVRQYSCKVIKLFPQKEAAQKGMIIEVTDPALIDKTGGIVQGMSGSPVIADGKLVGVVTHVMINDPTRGYCIYAYWMAELMENS